MERSCLAGAAGGARPGSGMGSWLHTDAHLWNTDTLQGHSRGPDLVHLPLRGVAEPGGKHGSEPCPAQGAVLDPARPPAGLHVAIF